MLQALALTSLRSALSPSIDDWAAGTRSSIDWLQWTGVLGAVLLGVCFLLLVVRGVLQRSRYSAAEMFEPAEQAKIAQGIADLEKRTDGEVAVVIVERSDRHPAAHWVAAVITLLLGSALASPWMPWTQPLLFFAAQFAFGALGMALALGIPGFRRVFVTEERAIEVAEEQATQEFYLHGLQRTAGETGVLIFVSLFERRVVVLGDRGIDAMLDAKHWERVDEAVLDGIRAGSLSAGLSKALVECGDVLAKHFPATGSHSNEVANHVVVRRE